MIQNLKQINLKKKVLLYVLLFGLQSVFGQNATTSLNINIDNVRLSPDAKTLSYDVSFQNVNNDTIVAVPGFFVQFAIPQSDIGSNEKKITITNATKELGVCAQTITKSGSDWILKFLNGNLIKSYNTALIVSRKYPGTRIGTFNVMNADGSAFSKELTFNLNYSGSGIKNKTICSVFKPNSTKLASNSSKAQVYSNFTGLGTYSFLTTMAQNITTGFSLFPNPADNSFVVNIGSKIDMVNIFDQNGKKVISQLVNGNAEINISSLFKGVYIVSVDRIQKKLIKN